MSLGLLCVSDLIAVGKLISDITSSLSETNGAAHHYRHLMLELESLGSILRELDRLTAPPELVPTLNAIKATALSCRLPLEAFQREHKKYGLRLGINSSSDRIQTAGAKVRWALGKQDAVNELRQKLNAHVNCISMLMGLYQIKHNALATDRMASELESSKVAIENLEKTVLRSSDNILASQQKLGDDLGTIVRWIPGVKAIYDTTRKIWALNLDMFDMLQALTTSMPSPDTRYTYFQAPIVFEDGLGRKIPIPSEYDWDTIEAIIQARFREGPGSRTVKIGHYELYDSSNRRNAITKDNWPALLPGQRIVMAMLVDFVTEKDEYSQCPISSCRSSEVAKAPWGGMMCRECNVWFDKKDSPPNVEILAQEAPNSVDGQNCLPPGNNIYNGKWVVDGLNHFRNIRVTNVSKALENAMIMQASINLCRELSKSQPGGSGFVVSFYEHGAFVSFPTQEIDPSL